MASHRPYRTYDIAGLWEWMQGRQVTAREMAAYLGCTQSYICPVLARLEGMGHKVALIGYRPTGKRKAALYAPLDDGID